MDHGKHAREYQNCNGPIRVGTRRCSARVPPPKRWILALRSSGLGIGSPRTNGRSQNGSGKIACYQPRFFGRPWLANFSYCAQGFQYLAQLGICTRSPQGRTRDADKGTQVVMTYLTERAGLRPYSMMAIADGPCRACARGNAQLDPLPGSPCHPASVHPGWSLPACAESDSL